MSLTKLQEAMQLLMRTFYEYSTMQGDSETMTKTEVMVTLRSELKEVSRKDETLLYHRAMNVSLTCFMFDNLLTHPAVFLPLAHVHGRDGKSVQKSGYRR